MVYIIVDKKIELEIKLLGDCLEWHFLPEEDMQIKTIEIYFDLKVAKRDCKRSGNCYPIRMFLKLLQE